MSRRTVIQSTYLVVICLLFIECRPFTPSPVGRFQTMKDSWKRFSDSQNNPAGGPPAMENGVAGGGSPVGVSSGPLSSSGRPSQMVGEGPPGQGGPPVPQQGGPPIGGPPIGGPPGGGGGGGPPQQPSLVQKMLDAAFEVAFSLLYVGDTSGIEDSSKNLRVLWTRALLNSLNKIHDPIAIQLLPPVSRWIVGSQAANLIWKNNEEIVGKLDWIVNRTQFIDSQLDTFLQETSDLSPNKPRQVLLLGSGYDTRALRYMKQSSMDQVRIDFYEVDLPSVSFMKRKMVEQYIASATDSSETSSTTSGTIQHIPLDLNELLTKNKSIITELREVGFQDDLPTMIICEAVLFYLIPGAVQTLIPQLFALNATRYCITDNLAKVGVTPGPPMPKSPKEKCKEWLETNGKELLDHDAIWGGAIHFVSAK